MADITREIVVKGYNGDKPFVPSKYIRDSFAYTEEDDVHVDADFIIHEDPYLTYAELHSAMYLLNKWQFDYGKLIEKGLAVDINTIKR